MTLKLGVYDPTGHYLSQTNLTWRHQFFVWNWPAGTPVYNFIRASLALNVLPIITIQPYADLTIGSIQTLLTDITAGAYDPAIQQICSEINMARHRVLIRWGQEMESSAGHYDWADADPNTYKSAYRYVVKMMQNLILPPALGLFIFGPAGEPALVDYYPGDDVADYIGLDLKSFFESDGGTSFAQLLGPAYQLCYNINPNKPVLVTEMGGYSSTDPDYKNQWVQAALSIAPAYPGVAGLVYFSAPSPFAWGSFGKPDFTLSPLVWKLPAGA
jgi:beta-mannanase